MDPLFDVAPVRPPVRRGQSSRLMQRARGPWPPLDRPQPDVAIVAVRVLIVASRLRSSLRRVARAGGVPRDVIELLLLFAESNGTLQVSEIADRLGIHKSTASRLARRAEATGLVDKLFDAIDFRSVRCRLSPRGRAATEACLDALRPHASRLLGDLDAANAATAADLLRAARAYRRRAYIPGWRAGVRAGMPAGE
jgi:DNA-binding MarR family transcriptional regulator